MKYHGVLFPSVAPNNYIIVDEYTHSTLLSASTRGFGAVITQDDGAMISLSPGFSFISNRMESVSDEDKDALATARSVKP